MHSLRVQRARIEIDFITKRKTLLLEKKTRGSETSIDTDRPRTCN